MCMAKSQTTHPDLASHWYYESPREILTSLRSKAKLFWQDSTHLFCLKQEEGISEFGHHLQSGHITSVQSYIDQET